MAKRNLNLAPGSVVFTGRQKVEKIYIHYLQYNANKLTNLTLDNHSKITISPSDDGLIDWYDIRGLHDTFLLEALGKSFAIHPLVLEDIADIHQRAKFEEYEQGNFLTLKSLNFDSSNLEIHTEHVALYFNNELAISFQETESDLFIHVRTRVQTGRGKVRNKEADFLAYALVDTVVDNYFTILDQVELVIETLEEDLLLNPNKNIKNRIHHLKKELLKVRKSISPLREAISRFAKSDSDFIDEKTTVFVRDLYDHTIQVMDTLEGYRDTLNGLQDLYLSEISFKMNQVMQVLTIITTIFVPLSFLAGLYGMNFDHMPELHWEKGYYMLLSLMIVIVVLSLWYFKRKDWL